MNTNTLPTFSAKTIDDDLDIEFTMADVKAIDAGENHLVIYKHNKHMMCALDTFGLKTTWIPFKRNQSTAEMLAKAPDDFLCLFADGTIRRYAEPDHPMEEITHISFFPEPLSK